MCLPSYTIQNIDLHSHRKQHGQQNAQKHDFPSTQQSHSECCQSFSKSHALTFGCVITTLKIYFNLI